MQHADTPTCSIDSVSKQIREGLTMTSGPPFTHAMQCTAQQAFFVCAGSHVEAECVAKAADQQVGKGPTQQA